MLLLVTDRNTTIQGKLVASFNVAMIKISLHSSSDAITTLNVNLCPLWIQSNCIWHLATLVAWHFKHMHSMYGESSLIFQQHPLSNLLPHISICEGFSCYLFQPANCIMMSFLMSQQAAAECMHESSAIQFLFCKCGNIFTMSVSFHIRHAFWTQQQKLSSMTLM